ncbi:iron-sulfur cluster-binding oxidoreductase [Citrifermentans bemidjiense Bem]|uniref:Iron-sulfur cluster-binding oxidoreductase n=1 Tax=Citrifermentans bemidjiense (strain ATCC BAA-1014 / DSM 16622 / JCM 12645 / Bem) TaxID=404380 RepID=B5EA18_CITBB|nr:DUF362 domain-containing protein [Citrifermentans bemidjiense]ACH37316.1 iron-sulfur cluster-binding oxidoreductase [Citrifermentans bemidjiense Bem]
MSSKVFFADMRAGARENLFAKIGRLMKEAGVEDAVAPGDLVAVKVHFGERGNHTFVRPIFVRRVVDEIKGCQGKPFLTDSSTLYPGERKEAVSALTCAIENGFAYAVVGAPLIMLDGIKGHNAKDVQVDGEILKTVNIGAEILEADSLVAVSHFKCHELTGFGGTLKNLGMGCSSRTGKMQQHSTVAPKVGERFCNGCEACLKSCAHAAIAIIEGKAQIDPAACVGCSRCITACQRKAINIQWNESASLVMRKMAEYAKGALHGKKGKTLFLNFITQVSPACDCYGHADAPIVNDIGICASADPVALDQACADLVNNARGNQDTALASGHEPGGDKFRGVHPEIDWEVQLEHAEKIGMGSRKYELVKI